MEDYQNPDSGTPENTEISSGHNIAIDDPAAASTDTMPPAGASSDSQFPDPYPQDNNQPWTATAQQQTSYQPQGAYQQYAHQQNVYRPQGAYQQQRPVYYQPQQNYQAPSNYRPPYPYQPNYAPQYVSYNNPARGKATAALVLGIISLVFCWMSFFAVVSVVCSIIGIIMGSGARKQLPPEGRGQATAGFVCSIIGLVIAILMLILFTVIIIAAINYGTTEFGSIYGM